MKQTTIERILKQYGYDFKAVSSPQKGYRNESYKVTLKDGQLINLILYKSEPRILDRIKRANRVSDYLASKGSPVRASVSDKIIKLHTQNFEKYGAVYNYLPGKTIPWEAYTKDHIKLLGFALSDMHAQLQDLQLDLPNVTDEYATINQRMEKYFADTNVKKAMSNKLGVHFKDQTFLHNAELLKLTSKMPEQQPLHMDLVRGNILFDENQDSRWSLGKVSISGILDFEKAAFGHPIFDIARTLAFLLVDCKYKSHDKIYKYFIKSGYNKRGSNNYIKYSTLINGSNTDLLEACINLFLGYDFYKFLKHNPYEFLEMNEHYIRTRELLIKRQLLMVE